MFKITNFPEINAINMDCALDGWPVVYILSNNDEVYVGETTNLRMRLAQHLSNPARKDLKSLHVISGETFNKSVTLDLEAYLISHMSADDRFKRLQNGNASQQCHNYYQRETYEAQFGGIWEQLKKLELVNESIHEIENSNLFKYSPYKTLTADQYAACFDIVKSLVQAVSKKRDSAFIVNGDPGTGKTVLAIYLMKLLLTKPLDDIPFGNEALIENLAKLRELKPELKIGLVISMENLRNIVKKVFKNMGYSKMILSPSEVANDTENFDILIVDEAHRLKTARNMSGFELKNIHDNNLMLGLDELEGNHLDWVLKKSHHQILFYDANQSIKRTDIPPERFEELQKQKNTHIFTLSSQLRCGEEGEKYVNYIKSIFSNAPPTPQCFKDYDVKVFDNVKNMTDAIIKKDADINIGLSRTVAGFAWPWSTKEQIHPQSAVETAACIAQGCYDIDIDGYKYIWNTKYDSWATSPNSVNEIGCIHTIQGFDLNYAGVIIGPELCYSDEAQSFYIKRENYRDANGKNMTDDRDLLRYVLNIYKVLCTRGMHGTYIYACDEGLHNYLKHFFAMA